MTYRQFSAVALIVATVFACNTNAHAAERVALRGDAAAVDVYFAPQDDISLYLVDFISKAQRRVWLAGYTFTMPEIARAVSQAKARGLDVRVVLDASQSGEKYSGATYLRNAGVPVWINSRHAIMHHKFVVCDDDRVGFGSANFTKAAMAGRKADPARSNAENFNLFVGVPALAKQYADEFERLTAESTR
jgi:phosphatidylserine/phosphatidylglycerophosphate/cardiolipin synthase-like enzyme